MTRPKNLHAWINTILTGLLLWLLVDSWLGFDMRIRANSEEYLAHHRLHHAQAHLQP